MKKTFTQYIKESKDPAMNWGNDVKHFWGIDKLSFDDYAKTEEDEKWSGDVKTKWHPKEGFFDRSASEIASGLKSASDDLKQAMSRLNFYINRAGDNLSSEDKSRLELAKNKLSALYEK